MRDAARAKIAIIENIGACHNHIKHQHKHQHINTPIKRHANISINHYHTSAT